MGHYSDDGRYHTTAGQVFHNLADKVAHHHHHGHNEHIDVNIRENITISGNGAPAVHTRPISNGSSHLPNTVSIPCNHIRLGDFLILQGRPCQVIRISTSSATGQYRYLGVDLFTKQLHEESSFISNPAPSVVIQTMLGPIFKQYRVLDMNDGFVTAMTETGDVKQGLAVVDQSNLWSRLKGAFESGRGSLRVLVLNDGPREIAVEMKVIHGSRL
ncbi:Woronin body major protein [Escovopsis weberi]|uniref:Woronin body major protein n=1 Tax=Escovopsis weberi TaxID=150374 RepID=A0A0M8MZL0_ESCWE|nr:Woronin body major protein [Escovopsis weberi]